MSNLERRLERLEAWAGSERCPTCRDWLPLRTELPAEGDILTPERKAMLPPQPPAECPDCGWQPDVIRVVYVDWHVAEFRDGVRGLSCRHALPAGTARLGLLKALGGAVKLQLELQYRAGECAGDAGQRSDASSPDLSRSRYVSVTRTVCRRKSSESRAAGFCNDLQTGRRRPTPGRVRVSWRSAPVACRS